MTISTGAAPSTHTTAGALFRGFATGGVVGGSLAALVVGAVVESVPLFVTGWVLPVVYGLLYFLSGMPRRLREAAVEPCMALAKIESLEAVGAESGDVPVRFDLTVEPDGAAAFRVTTTDGINLVDLSDYRLGGIVVVRYPPQRPWRVRIVKRPPPQWQERAAGAAIDSAPKASTVSEPPEGCAVGLLALLGVLLGAAVVIALFRTELFDDTTTRPASTARPSASTTSSTTVVSSASGTVTLGPGQLFLDPGELRQAVDGLTAGKADGQALTVVVQERVLSVVFAPTGMQASGFDPRSLPYERFPALVEDARTTLGVHAPQSWQITATGLAGPVTLKVTVTGSTGAASLDADATGKVVRRFPAH
ncbi:hypothetical protein [Actinacidiphila bryophytorum]|uniref:Uncharacterized protein n=1 Tax=Actinacidiphila bryophytorum TaxID=1436133 RepID=A0A9W4H366_9ACTN|nr:hypothetical protein [Actinacidiphila bryophytorum]MBM9440909.1 hypothetical protein [Actinacidiphila bryophytorum]MBN6542627.1 hypothetical protein [Actinacidiphila bryophytorum]CAG7647055.1 conserved membrane hypothetical protein [Actinacidiphila bryophytorum]